jgi:hypothetical protein
MSGIFGDRVRRPWFWQGIAVEGRDAEPLLGEGSDSCSETGRRLVLTKHNGMIPFLGIYKNLIPSFFFKLREFGSHLFDLGCSKLVPSVRINQLQLLNAPTGAHPIGSLFWWGNYSGLTCPWRIFSENRVLAILAHRTRLL